MTTIRVIALILVLLVPSVAAAQAPQLPEAERLKAQVHLLSVQNVQLRAELARTAAELDMAKLAAERAQLEQQFRAALKPPAGSTFNWQTLAFDAPKEPAK